MPFQKGHGSLRSNESYKKQGKRMIGHLVSDKTREILRLKFKGRKVSKKSRIKDSKAIKNLWKQKWYRDKLVKAHIGQVNCFKGKKRPEITEEKHPMWLGDKVGYAGLHQWVRKHLGKPTKCEHCSKEILYSKSIHWANKSGKYKRDRSDWIRLCVKCHSKYDHGKNIYQQFHI